jgi:phage-related minor tail protein
VASRNLGTLTLDLVARTAGFVTGMSAAERQVDKSAKRIKNSLGSLKGAIGGAIAGIGLATAIRAIAANTIESENAIRQLEARIKSTGGAAGLSSEQLQDFAQELQKITTFGDDAILAMQGVLLTFTNIRGDVFKDATRAILDLSIAMGQDLQSSAVQLGKALNDPVKGITALSKIGVAFTEDQKNLIKAFVEVGDRASAQRIILNELRTEFGGAAEAASNTFGGALTQLHNAFGDLLEGKGGVNDATASIKRLTALLQDPATIAAAEALTTAIITGFTKATAAIAGTVNLTRFVGESFAAAIHGAAADDIVRLEDELEKLNQLRSMEWWDKDIANRLRVFGKNGLFEWYSDDDLDKAIAEVQKKIKDYYANATPPPIIPTPGGGDGGGDIPPPPPVSELREIKIKVAKIEDTATEKFWKELDAATRTQSENAVRSFHEQKAALDELWAAGLVGVDAYNARLQEMQDELLPEFEVTVKKLPEIIGRAFGELTDFMRGAAYGFESIITDSLLNGFEGGAKGILKSFGQLMAQLIAQAVAADLTKRIFGAAAGGTGTGWLGMLAGAFGGAKASGGPVRAGMSYLVGERGPEMIVPSSNATVIPNGKFGSQNNYISLTVEAPTGRIPMETQQQIGNRIARSLGDARRRNG